MSENEDNIPVTTPSPSPTPLGRLLEMPLYPRMIAQQMSKKSSLRAFALVSRATYANVLPILYRTVKIIFNDDDGDMIGAFCESQGLKYVKKVILRTGISPCECRRDYHSNTMYMEELEDDILGAITNNSPHVVEEDIDIRRGHRYRDWRWCYPGSDAETEDTEAEDDDDADEEEEPLLTEREHEGYTTDEDAESEDESKGVNDACW